MISGLRVVEVAPRNAATVGGPEGSSRRLLSERRASMVTMSSAAMGMVFVVGEETLPLKWCIRLHICGHGGLQREIDKLLG